MVLEVLLFLGLLVLMDLPDQDLLGLRDSPDHKEFKDSLGLRGVSDLPDH